MFFVLKAEKADATIGGIKSGFGHLYFVNVNMLATVAFVMALCGCMTLSDSRAVPGDFRKYGYDSSMPIEIGRYKSMSADEVVSVFVNHLALSTGQKLQSIPRESPSLQSELPVVSYLLFNTELDKAYVLYFRIDRKRENGVHPFELRPPEGLVITF